MKLFPAIDIRNGNVVRLTKGSFDAETVYAQDPLSVAQSFVDAGAEWIHVVDLDAARTGTPHNLAVIGKIAQRTGVLVQSGGGVRDAKSAEALLSVGVARVVIGTAAQHDPDFVDQLAGSFPGAVAVGIDATAGQVAVDGWQQTSNTTVFAMIERFEQSGVAAFIVTDIEHDGMLTGPDVQGLTAVLARTGVDVIASGGVATVDDLHELAGVRSQNGGRLAGVIVGKALYEGRFDVRQALSACAGQL